MVQHQVTLAFPSLNLLWSFVREAKINYVEFNAESFTLVCNCPQTDIDYAKERFGAIEM
jgi:hypothetical protein